MSPTETPKRRSRKLTQGSLGRGTSTSFEPKAFCTPLLDQPEFCKANMFALFASRDHNRIGLSVGFSGRDVFFFFESSLFIRDRTIVVFIADLELSADNFIVTFIYVVGRARIRRTRIVFRANGHLTFLKAGGKNEQGR